MQVSTEGESYDIVEELRRLASPLHQMKNFPRSYFEKKTLGFEKKTMRSAFSFPCSESEDLYFSNYYGDSWMSRMNVPSKKMAIKRRIRRKLPSDISPDLIKGIIAECLDAVRDIDKEFTTLKVIVGRVYFNCAKDMSIDEEQQLFDGRAHCGQYFVYQGDKRRMSFYHQVCEWLSPGSTLRFLEENGFSITSREPLDPEVSLTVRGNQVISKEYRVFGNVLKLNPTTLAVESWKVKSMHHMNYHIMHGFPSSNDVIIRTHVQRFVDFAQLLALKGDTEVPGFMAVDEETGSFIRRTDVGFKVMNRYEKLNCITEMGNGERIYLKRGNVPCFMNLAPIKYYPFNSQINEFTLLDDQSCLAVIEFPFFENREELIEAITHLTLLLLSKANDDKVLQLTVSPQYIKQSDGTIVPTYAAQSIMRLNEEEGDLYHLLGLGDNPTRTECLRKAGALKSILLRSRYQEWFSTANLNYEELMTKLTDACATYNIDL